jgi:hypothetical protein
MTELCSSVQPPSQKFHITLNCSCRIVLNPFRSVRGVCAEMGPFSGLWLTEIADTYSLLQLCCRSSVIDCCILHVVVLHRNGKVDCKNFMENGM